jgi:hypothetical protein
MYHSINIIVFRLVILITIMGTIAHAQQQLPVQQPTGPTVEQRLGSTIAALIVENARLATELENARQHVMKLQSELNELNDKGRK